MTSRQTSTGKSSHVVRDPVSYVSAVLMFAFRNNFPGRPKWILIGGGGAYNSTMEGLVFWRKPRISVESTVFWVGRVGEVGGC